MSNSFLSISAYNTKKAREIEFNFTSGFSDDETFIKHRSYVISAIFSSVAFLESTINQIFWNCLKNPNRYKNIPYKDKEIIGDFWSQINSSRKNIFDDDIKNKLENILMLRKGNINKYNDTKRNLKDYDKEISNQINQNKLMSPILINKYQFILFINNKNLFNGHDSNFRNVKLVIELRNNITHYVPEIINENFQKIENKIRTNTKFKLNPLVGESSLFFPHKCLSHGCAEWAFKSCMGFVDDFYNRIGIEKEYRKCNVKILKK